MKCYKSHANLKKADDVAQADGGLDENQTTRSAAVLKGARLGVLKSKYLNARIKDHNEVRNLLNYKGEVTRIKMNLDFEQQLKKDSAATSVVQYQIQKKLDKEAEEEESRLQRMISTNLYGINNKKAGPQVEFVDMNDSDSE